MPTLLSMYTFAKHSVPTYVPQAGLPTSRGHGAAGKGGHARSPGRRSQCRAYLNEASVDPRAGLHCLTLSCGVAWEGPAVPRAVRGPSEAEFT